MKKLLLLLLAVLAVRLAGRAVRRNAEVTAALWALVTMTALAGTASSPKTLTTEARLNALVPRVFPNTGGTVSGSMTVTGNHTVNGIITATSSGTHEFSGSLHSAGTVQADSQVVTGNVNSTGGGTNEFSGHIHAAGVGQFDSGVTTSAVTANSGATNEFSGGIHTAGNLVVDGTISASNFGGSQVQGGQAAVSTVTSAPASYSSSYETSLASAINGIISRLQSSGLIV